MNGYEGICMSGGKFLKACQVTDKIIEWIFILVPQNVLQKLYLKMCQKMFCEMFHKMFCENCTSKCAKKLFCKVFHKMFHEVFCKMFHKMCHEILRYKFWGTNFWGTFWGTSFEVQACASLYKLVPQDIYVKAPVPSILNQFLQTRYHLKA